MKSICPHCGVWFKVQNSEKICFMNKEEYIDYEQYCTGYEVEAFLCPHCNNIIIVLKEGEVFGTQTGQYYILEENVSNVKKIYPKSRAIELSFDIPQNYRQEYYEASQVLLYSPKSSAAICRRMLQQILREEYDIERRDLFQEIEAFISLPNVPSYLSSSVDAVRIIGNLAAHPQKSKQTGEIMEVEDGEAEWLLEVLEELLDFTFVQPQILHERKEKLNAKLRELGKAEIQT